MGLNLNLGSQVADPVINGGGGGTPKAGTLLFLPILGQSQAGGYNSSPALTTVADAKCKTLTNGPIDVDVAGSLIACIEGDTFSDTGGPAATPNVETSASVMLQQLKLWHNSATYTYASSVHATGGTTIQQLSKGTTRYTEVMAAVARMKVLADGLNFNFETHLIFFHGATGDNVTTTYKAKLKQLALDFRTDVAAYTSQANTYLFTHQQRVVAADNTDYGQQQVAAMLEDSKIVVCFNEVGGTTYQGDAIHHTNHGERYDGIQFARGIYRKLFSTGFAPLQLDSANFSYVHASKKIIIPVLNRIGALQITTNGGIQVYSTTSAQILASTVAVNGSNIEITLTDTLYPLGQQNIEIRTGVEANGRLKDTASGSDIPTFLDGSSNPYSTDKLMMRTIYTISVTFPVTGVIAFGVDGNTVTNPKPNTPGIYELWTDNVKQTTQRNLTVYGNVIWSQMNNATNYWGFTSTTQMGGLNSLTGTNLYNNNVLKSYHFIENKFVDNVLGGLNPAKLYTLAFSTLRSNTATLRQTIITINGDSAGAITKQSNTTGGDSVFTSSSQQHIFTHVAPNGAGQITVRIDQNSTQFGYLNVLEITEE